MHRSPSEALREMNGYPKVPPEHLLQPHHVRHHGNLGLELWTHPSHQRLPGDEEALTPILQEVAPHPVLQR